MARRAIRPGRDWRRGPELMPWTSQSDCRECISKALSPSCSCSGPKRGARRNDGRQRSAAIPAPRVACPRGHRLFLRRMDRIGRSVQRWPNQLRTVAGRDGRDLVDVVDTRRRSE
jgi:hypothetical protein